MALYVKNDEKRSELRERIAAEMRAKAAAASKNDDTPDTTATDMAQSYSDGTKASSPLLALWLVLAVVAVGVVIYVIVSSSR